VDASGFGIGMLRAAAEAGMVGGIADWFAVTALFRHPFGIPVPHTAIIPNNQERIARTLGNFVERHFLTEDVLLRRLEGMDIGRRFAVWLARPGTARLLSGPVALTLAQILRSLGDRDLQLLANRLLGERLRKADLAPLLGRVLRALTTSGEADALFERAVDVAGRWLEANRHRIDMLVDEHSRWWVPKSIDRRIADVILADVAQILERLKESDSSARAQFREALASLIDDLLSNPEQRARIDAAKNRLLDHPELQAWLAGMWRDLSADTLESLERRGSPARDSIARGIAAIGQALAADPAVQAQIDGAAARIARLMVEWRGEIGSFIADVVKGWDLRTLTERLELAVGSDLQYIRMNGTIVGACVGCIIFAVSWVLP
jgi:uncharacterized membrane-anchored protein YjiN (DUF445 family)